MFRESRLNEISTIYQDDAGTHFLLHVKTSLSDVEIKWAVRQKGILINCLSEYFSLMRISTMEYLELFLAESAD